MSRVEKKSSEHESESNLPSGASIHYPVSVPSYDRLNSSGSQLMEEDVFHDATSTPADTLMPTLAPDDSQLPLPPPNSSSLQAWEKKLWDNALVKCVQGRFKRVPSVEISPVSSRTRTSLKRSSSSADFDSEEKPVSEDRMSVSLRKARSKRKSREGVDCKRGKRED